jgi:GNAT superfamily N-acetyltransferase
VKTEPELISAANLNFIGSFRKLVDHTANGGFRDAEGVFAFATGIPLWLFNGCVVVEPAAPPELDAAIAWVSARGLPYCVWIDERFAQGLGDVPLAHGLQRSGAPDPGMVLHPPPKPPPMSPGVTVAPVTDVDLAEYHEVCIAGGLARELAYQLFSPSFAADPDVRLFTARLDGRPVGTSVAIRTGEVAGVYAVGTLPTARRRGVGAAVTWAAVGAGRAWGCDTIVLQASEMGVSLYASMGFRTVVSYAPFRHPPGA